MIDKEFTTTREFSFRISRMKTELWLSSLLFSPPLSSLFLIMRMDAFPQPEERCLSFCDHQAGWWPRKPDRLTVASFNADLYHRERREERRGERLGHCSSAHRLHSERWSPVIGAFARAFPPSTRVFASFFFFSPSPPSPLLSFLSFSPLLSPQPVNRRHRRLCANVFRNGEGRGESYACVIHCQDTIHDSAVALAFVRGWTEIRGGSFLVSIWFKKKNVRRDLLETTILSFSFSFTFLGWNCIKGKYIYIRRKFGIVNLDEVHISIYKFVFNIFSFYKSLHLNLLCKAYINETYLAYILFLILWATQFHFAVIDLPSSSSEARPLERYKSLSARQVTSTTSCIRSPFQRLDISIPVE